MPPQPPRMPDMSRRSALFAQPFEPPAERAKTPRPSGDALGYRVGLATNPNLESYRQFLHGVQAQKPGVKVGRAVLGGNPMGSG